MSRLLVTGGSGFIGTNLISDLESTFDICNFDICKPRNELHLNYWKNVDIRNYENLRKEAVKFRPDFIIHLAARTDLDSDNIADYDSNTVGTKNLVKLVNEFQSLTKIIFCSSKFIAPNGYIVSDQFDMIPHTTYGESKKLGEQFIWQNEPKCDWCIIRPTSIWGPYFDEPYKNFFEFISKGHYFRIGQKECYKTYGFVGNAVYQITGLLEADTRDLKSKVFYLGDYQPYEINEWASEIAHELDRTIPRVPSFLVVALAYFGDFLSLFGIKFPMTSFRYHNMTKDGTNDLERTKSIVPLLPYSRFDGTRKTCKWLRSLQSGQSK